MDFDFENYLKGSTERANKYVSNLKHGASFKFVKGFNNVQKTLLNIMLDRQNNGSFLFLSNDDLKAFGMERSDGNGMMVAIDVSVTGKLTIVPLKTL